jgi:hypothetical protein
MKTTRYLLLIISILYITTQSACKKDDLLTDGSATLEFSEDTILFDTVFVTLGSVTKNFKVFNTYDQPLKISNIKLAKGATSNFRINVNGLPGTNFKDIELRSGDSLWIFVEVTVDQNNQNLPFVIQDSITFETNGNQQDVDLVAWGQNAHFFVAKKQNANLPPYVIINSALNSTTTWNDSLPFVIYGGFAVVDSSTTLIIEAGTEINFSNSAGLWVYKSGNLTVYGTKENPVIFQGLRREASFDEEPGQWDRIWINDGGINTIDYAIIKNGFIGLQCETLFDPALAENLKITNTIVKNMSGLGILARNFNIEGFNDVFANCGLYAAAFTIGGDYDFRQTTFANYWTFGQRTNPSFYINNYTSDSNGDIVPVNLTKANFFNCIIAGNNDNEFEVDMTSGADSIYSFRNTLVTADTDHPTTGNGYVSIFRNENPRFVDTQKNNYELDTLSFCINKGDGLLIPSISFDLKGNNRTQGIAPDLGAYERE